MTTPDYDQAREEFHDLLYGGAVEEGATDQEKLRYILSAIAMALGVKAGFYSAS